MKVVAGPILRRFGFRNTLIWNQLLATACIAACATFQPGTPMPLIYAVLLVGGFFQSLQFTAYNTIAYADLRPERMSAATGFYTVFQQLMLSLGICLAAAALSATSSLAGRHVPDLGDFHIAFLVVSAVSLLSGPFCARLPATAGAEMSGHRAA
jgi:MFS family permease